jgi:acetyl-CoA C-acetyltransferase
MKKSYIVSAKRTAIGKFLGSLSTLHPKVYGAEVVKQILKESNIDPTTLDEVIVGNILPAGLGQGLARQISITAGIPSSVVAYGMNMVCGSGMKTVMQAHQGIQAGFLNAVLAGGAESMSQTPYLVSHLMRTGNKMGNLELKDHMLYDALSDAFEGYHMGVTAENIAERYNITRTMQDEFSMQSQLKARQANLSGRFKNEIVPITIPSKKGEVVFDQDEFINFDTTLDKLSALKPAFKKNGTVTAGSSSGINDGASFMLVVSEDYLNTNHLIPLAEIVGTGQGGVDPSVMGLGPTPAIIRALKMANLTLQDIEIFELNEAFASQALGVVHELSEHFQVEKEWILARTNYNGGAIALGHPVGASGNRIIVTLLHEMIKQNKTYGLASLCIGGGMGTAIILKREGSHETNK